MYIVFDDKDEWLDVDSKEFGVSYASNEKGYGLQCNYDETNDPYGINYRQIKEVMDTMRGCLLDLLYLNVLPFEKEENANAL